MNLTKLVGSFNFKRFSQTSRTGFGVLKVAFMVRSFAPILMTAILVSEVCRAFSIGVWSI